MRRGRVVRSGRSEMGDDTSNDDEIRDLKAALALSKRKIFGILTEMFSNEHAAGVLTDKENRAMIDGSTVSAGSRLKFSMDVRGHHGEEISSRSFCSEVAELAALSVNNALLPFRVSSLEYGRCCKVECEFTVDTVGELRLEVFLRAPDSCSVSRSAALYSYILHVASRPAASPAAFKFVADP